MHGRAGIVALHKQDKHLSWTARIRISGRGVEIRDKRLGCLAYADDIVLMAESKEDMEELLQVASNYGQEWNVR